MAGESDSEGELSDIQSAAGGKQRRRRVVDEDFVRGAEVKAKDAAAVPVAFPQFPLVRLDLDQDADTADVRAESAPLPIEESAPSAEQLAAKGDAIPVAGPERPRRMDAERQQQRRVASAQRQRHDELVKNWMSTQRGANVALATRIGSRTVEGWFKRTFIRLARMLYRIHTLPTEHVPPEAITKIEAEVLAAIAKAETALAQRRSQCEETLERVGGQRAFYSKHFELEIIVSTKSAMELHAVYHRADEVMLLVESLDFGGLLTDAQRRKQIGAIHAAIFGLSQSIERLHRGLYVRIAKGSD